VAQHVADVAARQPVAQGQGQQEEKDEQRPKTRMKACCACEKIYQQMPPTMYFGVRARFSRLCSMS
jgi:hypothetical protein